MEFHETLQELRKQKGLTQEELAASLYVSRTAISKWESGRGYPNIDSLKRIAALFSVTVDDLLSGNELLWVAEEETRQTEYRACDLVFGLLDICTALLLFLPLFAQRVNGAVKSVPLLSLTAISPYLRVFFFAFVALTVVWGVLTLALQNTRSAVWMTTKSKFSLIASAVGTVVFVLSLQPYAAVFTFAFLSIKVTMLIKRQ